MILSLSQRRAISKLIEKPNKELNSKLDPFHQKILLKAPAARLKKELPLFIRPGQTAFVSCKFIGESGRLIADILETTNLESIAGYLLSTAFEKIFL